jgi:hypothetical protein
MKDHTPLEPPDFSGLSDGSHRAEKLRQMLDHDPSDDRPAG